MDISEHTRIALGRIYQIEPENATKIIGYMLYQDQGDKNIVRLAGVPDQELYNVVTKVKLDLQRLATGSAPSPVSHSMMSPLVSAQTTGFIRSSHEELVLAGCLNPRKGMLDSSIMEPMQTVYLKSNCYRRDDVAADMQFSWCRRELPIKTCHYFNKGFCKHGTKCRFYHGQVNHEAGWYRMYGVNDDDQVLSQGSLAQLEEELVELLRPRNGDPLSIASLPMVYYDKYKKVLRADGYLTESQRYGKAGYTLTKLLARLKSSIRLIDRPHGQHAVILTEHAPEYFENRTHRSVDTSQTVSASRQIYLTFPAESTFTEEDVFNYFNNTFGCVEDVRIPCQQKRMFGFVTFVNANTVKAILEKGNPHFVSSSRVLVKPYREKSKLADRKFSERMEQSICYSPEYIHLHRKLTPMPKQETPQSFLGKDLMYAQEQAIEFEMRRLERLQHKPLFNSSYFGYSLDGLRSFSEEYLSRVVNDKQRDRHVNNSDHDSEVLNLPDSPFSIGSIALLSLEED